MTTEWITLTEEDITPPTQDGNWITIPRGTESYGYYDKETGEPWGRGDYYTLVNRVVEVRTLKHDVRFEEGLTTEWTMKYTPEDRTIYTNYFILDPDLYINDNPIKDKTNRGLDTRHDVIIEYRVSPDSYKRMESRDPGHIRVNGKNYPLEVNEEGTVASITYSGDDNYSITLSAPGLYAKPVTITYYGKNATLEVMLGHSVNYSLRNGESVEVPGDRYTDFWVRADEGYYFTDYGTLEHGSDTIDVPVRSDTENTVARISMNSLRYDSILTMGAVPIAEMVPTDVLGFNNIYLVTKETLSDVSLDIFRKRRSYYVTDPDGHRDIRWDPYVATDPHTYIINTIQLPIKIDENVVGPDVPIELGFTKLLTNAPMVTKDKVTVDLGEIKVPNTYNNIYDYSATDVFIHLPYTNPVVVDPHYVIGHELSVEYIIDVYTGETPINLRSSLVDEKVFYSTNTLMGNVVPFITIKDATTIGSPRESRSVIHNNTPTPYAEVVRKKPYQMDSQFNTNMRTTVDNLQDVTGRVYVNNISLEVDTTQMEVSLIKSILASGITIK